MKQNLQDIKKVRKILKYHFPKKKIGYIREFPEGFNNLAFDVHFVNSKEDKIVKILKIEGIERYALKQKLIRTILRKKFEDYPIPKIIKSDYSKKIIESPYIIAEKVKGDSLQSLYKKIKYGEELFEEIGELYGKMHSIKLSNYGELDSSLNIIKKYKSWYIEKCNYIKKILDKIEKNKLLSSKRLKFNKDFFEKHKLLLKKEIGPCLCHGDSALTNIIVNKSNKGYKVRGIIDFEFSRSSGVTHDLFGGVRGFDKKYQYRKNLVEGYTKWSKLPKEWEKLTLLYYWIRNLNQLSRVNKMKWRNLTKKEDEQRRKRIITSSIKNTNKIMKDFN